MDVNAPAGSAPPLLDASRIRDFDMFNVQSPDGEYQTAMHAYLREGEPRVFWTNANGGHWVFTKADDIERALNSPAIFSASKMFVPREKNPTPPLTPLMIDPPDHAKYRQMIMPAFTPKAVAHLADRARARAIELIDAIKPQGHCEFVHEFAERLPIDVFMGMLDLPAEDRDHLMLIGEHHVRPPTPQHHIDSMRQLQAYALRKITERRAKPDDGLITQLTQAQFDGKPLEDNALVGIIVLLLVAGLDTVAAQLGHFARFLALNPEARHTLAADAALIPKAVEELLRRYAMVTVGRILLEDYPIDGVTLRAGDIVIMPTIFISFDESRFADPLTVDFKRNAALHGNFGRGIHQCIGSMLARSELRVFVEEWLKRIPDFEIEPGTQLAVASGTVTGLRRLPLRWAAA